MCYQSTNEHKPIFVVGALNLDVCGVPDTQLAIGDSNPGQISLTAGGVGHNIAREIARGGRAVELVCLLGDDYAANMLRRFCSAEDIGLHHASPTPHPSSAYLCVENERGELFTSINDMALVDAFTQDRLAPVMAAINEAPLCVVDTNLPEETLAYLAQNAAVPLLLDPVSGFKAMRAKPFIGKFFAIKPNRLEAEHLSGQTDPDKMADWFLAEGVTQVYISLGLEGVLYATHDTRGRVPANPLRVRNDNGAGDALSAGIALGIVGGEPASKCAQMGIETVTQYLIRQGGTPI